MSLMQRVNMFLGEAINLASPYSELKELKKEISELKSRLNKPLRVAIVGVIKAGKSTLINGLLGEKRVATGNIETTYTPTWFKYSSAPGITVRLNNGKSIEGALSDINYWTVRNSTNPDLDKVLYVEIKIDNPFLKEIELIDTPGLESSYAKDSENTMKFIGINKNDISKVTINEASLADAIIYAFSRGIAVSDEEVLKSFHGPIFSNATPINAIGVLTKVDDYWSSGYDDPLEGGAKIVKNYKENSKVKSILYTVIPIIGRLAENRSCLDDRDKVVIESLGKLNPARFRKLLLSEERFCDKIYEDVSISPYEREHLWKKLGQYGVYTAVSAYQNGVSINNIGDYLYDKSGVEKLMNIIKNHFGNRSYLIKLQYVLSRVKGHCYTLMSSEGRNNHALYNSLECILSACEKLEAEEHAFAEIKVLQNYYNGTLKLYNSSDIEELLRITGENGSNCEARLGVQEGTSIRKLASIAKEKSQEWNLKANEGINSRSYEDMAKVLARSCEIMYYHLTYLAGYKDINWR